MIGKTPEEVEHEVEARVLVAEIAGMALAVEASGHAADAALRRHRANEGELSRLRLRHAEVEDRAHCTAHPQVQS